MDAQPASPFPSPFRRRSSPVQSWEIDETVIAAAETAGIPEVRDQLAPALVTAHARRARGYDRLHGALCRDDETLSSDRAHACSTLPAELEEGWRRSEHVEQGAIRGVATAVYAGALAETTAHPSTNASRDIATAAIVPVGATVGLMVFAGVTNAILDKHGAGAASYSPREQIVAACLEITGAIAGGVLGGSLAYAHTASPGSRSSTTFLALTPFYLTTLVMTTIDR